jgi:spermidine/putrescine-binding protein
MAAIPLMLCLLCLLCLLCACSGHGGEGTAVARPRDASSPYDTEKVVNVYSWADYIAPDTVSNFEKETGIKVRYDV